MTKKVTPEWVDGMNEDVVPKDYWHYGGLNGMPLRYTGGGYQHHGYGHHATHDYGADHSLRSSKYSHDSRRRRKNTCCIFLLLLLGAILIAIGIGIMVYYLLKSDDPKTTTHTATQADGSIPLLNVNYTDSMAQNSSEAFLAVSNPLCKELDTYFRDSKHRYRYQGCTIAELRPDENTETCECAGIINKARTTRAYFHLLFLGDISDIREEVRRVIQEKATRVTGRDYKALLVDKFIVDISSVFPEGFSTPRPPPAVGVLANLTIWVYNLTYSDDLLQPTSTAFQDIAQPFCADLAGLFRNSSLSGRYHSCEVKGFSSTPDVVNVHVWLTDDDITGVERDLRTIILDKARVIIIDGESRKIVGPLLITPAGDDGNVVIIPIPVNPLSTIKPTPTSTLGPGYERFIDMQLYLYGFTYNSSFASSSDPVFQVYAHNYCKDLERILLHSSWMGHFFGCRLYGFYHRPTPEEFPYFGTHLGIDDVITEQRSREIIDIIRNNATLVTVDNENLAVYQIGDLLVILGERIKINVTYLPSMMTSTMASTPSLTPSIMPTVFTTSFQVTPTPTPGQTVSASVSTIVIVYDSTTAFVDSELYDFTYNTVLTDTTSTLFLSIQNKFCNDLDDFFYMSELSNHYLDCRILQFMPGDNTHFKFLLTFRHALNSMLRTAVQRIILTAAPASQKGGYEVITIGDLDLIVDLIGYTASFTNYTEVTETTFQPSPTMTMTMTSTPYVTYSATLAEITCRVVSTIPPVLEIKSSPAFNIQQTAFCTALKSNVFPNILDPYAHITCYIVEFEVASKTVRFHNIFGKALSSDLGNQVLLAIYEHSPEVFVNGVPGRNVGGVWLAPNSCDISLVPVNYTDTMTVFPTIMPTSTVIQPTLDILHCLRQPCKNGGSCYEDSPGWSCQCMEGYTGKDCSMNIDDCDPNPCQNGGSCIDGIAAFTCDCPTGWTGTICTVDVDECMTDQHMCSPEGGVCVDNPGSYTCQCLSGYTGEFCDTEKDGCESAPCQNGGICTKTGPGTFMCDCPPLWSGPLCASYLGVCQPNPCQHGGICIDDDTTLRCVCPPQRTGPLCETDVNECDEDPQACSGHGLCVNEDGGYSCNCYSESYGPLWTGDTCEKDVNECLLGIPLCTNGECINQQGGYDCLCPANFTGDNCSIDINECESDPCLNGATCMNTYGGYKCMCVQGFTGKKCGTDIDECKPVNPCENDGTCYNSHGSFQCDCRPGWSGPFCSDDINECEQDPFKCKNGGTCTNLEGDYECSCTEEWSGKDCEIYSAPCGNLRCLHGGTCVVENGNSYCMCPPTRFGPRCENDVNECEIPDPVCKNGATCKNLMGSYYCNCAEGFEGPHCENDTNECDPSPCENNGVCENTFGSFICHCAQGWMGEYCNLDIPECDSVTDPCNNNGLCQEEPGSFRCDCFIGWTGTYCDEDENECETTGCLNEGICNNYPGSWNCTCQKGWTGLICETDVNECYLQDPPCKNGATCSNSNGDYDCYCTQFWMGKDCDTDVNECNESPPRCKNGATCQNSDGDYDCTCVSGWIGKECDVDENECQRVNPPCMNGATCKNIDGDYECNCTSGWTGKDCDIDLDECDVFGDDACFNQGTCNNTEGSFDCQCQPQFKGDDCSEDVNECTELATPPCKNGATCSNVYGDYYCNCVAGWKGKDCDTDVDECKESEVAVCSNGGTCTNSEGSFNCSCTPQFKGDTCDDDVDECLEQAQTTLCLNQGTCVNDYGDYHCDCTIEWTGKICQTNVDVCSQIPCVNGICEQVNGVYQCVCSSGWEGTACDINIDECLDPSTCKNEGTCEDTDGDYNCTCKIGYEGKQCEKDINECLNNPCLNGGTCLNNDGSYTCECIAGYEGDSCEDDTNECLNNPCKNGGTCLNNDGSYTCECMVGYEGDNCDDVSLPVVRRDSWQLTVTGNCPLDPFYRRSYTNECLNNPCMNGGTCLNNDGSYTCECMVGYEGDNCEDDTNECLDNPCMNGGTCLNNDGSYTCECMVGYEGDNCKDDTNECLDNPCINGGTCLNNNGSYTCECIVGYEGDNCEADTNECLNNPCKNGGTCLNNDGSYTCECMVGYEGDNCENDTNECLNNPCKNGGTCIDNDGSYTCECMAGYEGSVCGDDINECLSTPCLNGATCINTDGSYMCECVQGFTGDDCGTDINECSPFNPCANGGTCVNLIPGFRCDCPQGLSGPLCDGNIDECILNPCLNGATCIDTFSSFECECVVGYTGDTCGGDIDECMNDPCQNGATCMNNFGSYGCNCTVGWQGQDCETDIDECFNDPCQNDATCVNNDGSYECNCTEGWHGQDCDIDIDECSNEPCQNGATCVNDNGSYYCNCTGGFQGQDCETDIDECFNGPCLNGATCVNNFGSYECNCTEGWQGKDCNTDVEECLANPCENGATCVEQQGFYECDCPLGWQGTHCNIDIDECFDNPCQNDGTCVNEFGSYYCNCTTGFTGQNCGSVLQFEFPIQMDLADDVSNLLNTGTQVFQDYASAFCNDMTSILFSAPENQFENYADCEVTSYQIQPNKINWVAHFIKVAPDTVIDDIKNYVLSLPTEILDDKNVINVGNNYIYHSDVISTFPIEFDIVDDLSGLPDLLNPTSQLFQEYSDAFCSDIADILAASGSFQEFAQCRVISFADNKINWMADFSGIVDGSTGDDIRNYILSQPKEIVDDKNAISVGNNYIYHSDYISPFPIEFDITDDLSGLPDLLNPDSQLFQDYSDAFCTDISNLLAASGSFPKYRQCRVISFADNKINLIADITGVADVSTGDNIKNYILSQPKEIVDDKNVIGIGNNNIYHSDYISTFSIEFDIVDDLSGMPDLLNPDSQIFKDYSDAFCNDISALLVTAGSFPKFRQCRVISFANNKINWIADINGVADVSTGDTIKDYILSQPTEIVDDKNVISVGNNNIYVSDYISTFSIQFDLVDDLSGLPDLLDPTTQMFQDYSDAFCNDISDILVSSNSFEKFRQCRVISFADNKINWMADFSGVADVSTGNDIKNYVLSLPTEIVNDKNAINIGNNNIYVSDYISTFPIEFDLVDDLSGLPDLLNPASQLFQDYSDAFCNDLSALLVAAGLFQKFRECRVISFADNKINWIADFTGVVDVSTGDSIKNYILSQPTEIVDDKNAINIGNNYIYVSDYISTFPIEFDLVDDISGLPDLLNPASQLFQDYSDAFCNDISALMVAAGSFQKFRECRVMSFADNKINWMADINGVADVSTGDTIKNYILSQPTEIVDDKNAINIGNNYIYVSDYISTFPIEFDHVDDLSGLPDLLNPASQLFQDYSDAFCADISAILASSESFEKFRQCRVISFADNKINWMADVSGLADASTGNDIRSHILAQPTEIVDDKNAINIGNNYIYVSDYISTFPIEFDLVDDISGLPDLLNPASQLFQDYSDAFCNDISALLVDAGLFQKFRECRVNSFADNKISWMADVTGVADMSTGDAIKNYILSQPTEIVDDTNAINIGNNYIYVSDYISTFPIEFDLVDDLSGLPDLLNPASQLFQDYSDAFCADISAILAASGSFVKFRQCRVISFADNKINWMADVTGVSDVSTGTDIKNYILSLPTEIVDDKNAINIGNNNIYVSDYISTFPIEFDLVDDLSGLPDLLNPASQLFQAYSDAFCNDVSAILAASGSFEKFRQCRVISFADNKINWMADISGVADASTGTSIRNYILAQPTEIVDDKNAVNIGNNYIYVSDYISTFPIQFDLVDDLTGLQDLLNPASQLFQDYSNAFCNDIQPILDTTTFFQSYISCTVVNYTSGLTPNARDVINWLAHFSGVVAESTGQDVKAYIREYPQKIVIDESYAIEIGNNYIYHSDYITTDVVFNRRLLNFTFIPALANPSSADFQNIQASFCNNVVLIIQQNAGTFSNYANCSIQSYSVNDNGEDMVNFQLQFIGLQDAEQIKTDFNAALEKDLPRVTFGRNEGYRVGDLVLFHGVLGTLTTVQMTYDLLNLTYSADLGDPSSTEFMTHASLFCNDTIELIRGEVANDYSCTVDAFTDQEPFVQVTFTFEFLETLDVPTLQDLISGKIFNERPRVRVDNNVGNVVGDVVVYYDSLLDYMFIKYNGWVMNVTEDVFGLGYDQNNLDDPSSETYQLIQTVICDEYEEKFAGNGSRFADCYIPEFRPPSPPSQQYTEAVVSLVFRDKEPMFEEEIKTVMRDFNPVPVLGRNWSHVGDYVLFITDFEEIMVNVSGYIQDLTTTTENPNPVITTLELQFQLTNFTLTEALEDTTSDDFQQVETEFCTWGNGLNEIYGPKIGGYTNCSLIQFRNETNENGTDVDYVDVSLVFKGDLQSDIQEKLRTVLIENGKRVSLAPMVWVVEVPANSTMPLYIYFNYLRSADFITNTIITGGSTTLPSV